MNSRRWVAFVALALGVVFAAAAPAAADPAGPTDYRTEVLSIEPADAPVAVEIIGGDSFVHLTVEPGHEVLVVGYRGEPYLRFEADGTVLENRASVSYWLNQDRYSTDPPAEFADPDVEHEPVWEVVASGGSYAWHDHRSHWMNSVRPPGKGPGDVILEDIVPLLVDGSEVDVTVRSTWADAPSSVPWIAAAVVVAVSAGVLARRSTTRGTATSAAVVAGAGVAAAAVGVAAHRSVPPETGPSPLLWLLPVVAVVAATIAAVLWRRSTALVAGSLVSVAGLMLAVWAWVRREALVRAIIPSDAPPVLDRMVIAVAAVTGLVAIVAGVVAVATPPRGSTASGSR